MIVSFLYPLIILLQFEIDVDLPTVSTAFYEAVKQFEKIVEPRPELYENSSKQYITIKRLSNVNFLGLYVFTRSFNILRSEVYINENLSRSQMIPTLIHELIHSFTEQTVGSIPWLVREGVAEFATLNITKRKLSDFCRNVKFFSYDRLFNRGGYTEAVATIAYFKTRLKLPGLLSKYFFCVKNKNKNTSLCFGDFKRCLDKPYQSCLEPFTKCTELHTSSSICNSAYRLCLQKCDSEFSLSSQICQTEKRNCLTRLDKRCENIIKPYFKPYEYKRFIRVCKSGLYNNLFRL